jgi:hypothetical protein
MRIRGVHWKDAGKELPDDEMTVLVALVDGEVWAGWHEDGRWWYVTGEGERVEFNPQVVWWADFPAPPGGAR